MAVPGHDTRDFEFAEKFGLPVAQVVQPPEGKDWRGFVDDGIAVNSANDEISLNGLPTPEAKRKITEWLERKGMGARTINYKLRDWLFSRQRYWGEPFPILWRKDADGNAYHEALAESELPLLPPALDDYKPTPDGQPPLARATEWVNLPDGSKRETNTMPQWAGSCWYYLRYLDAGNGKEFCGREAEHYWMGRGETLNFKPETLNKEAGAGGIADSQSQIANSKLQIASGKEGIANSQSPIAKTTPGVDLYVGGTEHAVLHLLYARFWHKVLFDLGYVSTPEPFFKLVNQGLILGEDNQKMSKARGNVVNPDDMVREFGADSLRLYEMFMGPLEMVKPWSTKGVKGVYGFLGRVWRLFVDEKSETDFEQGLTAEPQRGAELVEKIELSERITEAEATPAQLKTLHAAIKKATEDLDGLKFNTVISALMEFVNDALHWEVKPAKVLRDFLVLLQPLAPHIAEELWEKMVRKGFAPGIALAYAPWPSFDEALLVEDTLEILVQVNGKLLDVIKISTNASKEELESAARGSEKVKSFVDGKAIKKVIVLPKKLVNIVVG